MLRYAYIGCLGYLLACQTPSSQKSPDTTPGTETYSQSTSDTSATTLAAMHQQLMQDARHVQQLRAYMHQSLDSLYQLETSADVQKQIDEHETAYLALAEADEAFINWQNHYSVSPDSLGNIGDTALVRQVKERMELLAVQLRENIQRSQTLLFP